MSLCQCKIILQIGIQRAPKAAAFSKVEMRYSVSTLFPVRHALPVCGQCAVEGAEQ